MEVNSVIDSLCDRLGVAAEYLMPKVESYLVARDSSTILTALVVAIICGILARMLYLNGVKLLKAPDSKYDDWSDLPVTIVFIATLIILVVVALIIIIENVPTLVLDLTSPEVSAINYILGTVK